MSRAAFAHDTDSATKQASSVRVSHPGDTFEVEADRVADTVASGGRVPAWSLSSSGFDGIHRQAAPQPSTGDMAGKVAEALLATPAGKQAVDAVTSAISTPGGMVVTGSAAVGVVAALAKAKQPLPVQPPAVPLDILHPGLSAKITYSGPVERPTGASITFSYTPKSEAPKPAHTASEEYRAETAAMAADQEKFRAGLQPRGLQGPVKTPEQQAFDKWQSDRLAAIGSRFAGPLGSIPAAPGAATPAPAPAAAVTPHPADAPLAAVPKPSPSIVAPTTPLKAAAAPERKPDPKPAATPAASMPKPAPGLKEELPILRKAESSARVPTGSPDVDAVLQSSGRPLDPATRRDMESRIGYDFSGVRLHTDTRAADSAQSLSAHAYTVGSNVVFAPGRYAPQTTAGRHLLAHELTHVVQQTSSPQRAHPAVRPAPRQVQRAWAGRNLPGVGWLLDKIKNLKGYQLFCVVIGKDLIDDKEVERNATTLTQGVLNLFDGGPALFEKLKKAAGALKTAYDWLVGEIDKAGLSEKYFSDLLDRAWAAVDKWHPFDSWDRIKGMLEDPLNKLIGLAKAIATKVMEFILEAAFAVFPAGKKIYGILKKAGESLSKIIADPLSFAKNLFAAVQKGFGDFGTNILKHLGDGLKTWIFEELAIKGVTMPTEFTFASILKLILQVLGLTYEQRRPQLVEKLGEPVVYFFETSAKVLDRIRKEGFSAVWDMIKERASSIFDSIIDSVKDWVIKEIVKLGLLKVAALATPVGEIIEIVTSIYETFEFIVEKASKLVDLVETVVNAISDIVAGTIGPAAQKVEDSLARTIPLLLRFLAGLLHLSGIGASIRKIIDDVRKPIDDVIGKVLDFIVEKAKPLWEQGKAAFTSKLDAIKDWWSKPAKFNYGDEEHELTIEGEGDKEPEVYVNSDRSRLKVFLQDHKAGTKQTQEALRLAKGLTWKEGKLESLSKKEAGYNNFVALTKLMNNLKSKYPLKSEVNDRNSVNEFGGGVHAEAFLSSDLLTGSSPTGTDPAVWNDLGYLLPPNPPYYVRGHLISEKLGGRGEWTNLMPITNAANGEMERTVEAPLKEATSDPKNGNYYCYKVVATYANPRVPSEKNATTEADRDARSDQAEKRLKQLSWTVTAAENDNGTWKDTKLVPRDAKNNPMPAAVKSGKIDPRLRP